MENILKRRSVRLFDLTKTIPNETLVELCKAGESAPSARRQKSREYIIIDDKGIIDRLSLVAQGSMILKNCNHIIAVIGKDPKALVTPHMQVSDLAAATENILLAATSLNIGSCWIGISPVSERLEKTKEILQINDDRFVFSLIALGIPQSSDAFYDSKKYDDITINYNRG